MFVISGNYRDRSSEYRYLIRKKGAALSTARACKRVEAENGYLGTSFEGEDGFGCFQVLFAESAVGFEFQDEEPAMRDLQFVYPIGFVDAETGGTLHGQPLSKITMGADGKVQAAAKEQPRSFFHGARHGMANRMWDQLYNGAMSKMEIKFEASYDPAWIKSVRDAAPPAEPANTESNGELSAVWRDRFEAMIMGMPIAAVPSRQNGKGNLRRQMFEAHFRVPEKEPDVAAEKSVEPVIEQPTVPNGLFAFRSSWGIPPTLTYANLLMLDEAFSRTPPDPRPVAKANVYGIPMREFVASLRDDSLPGDRGQDVRREVMERQSAEPPEVKPSATPKLDSIFGMPLSELMKTVEDRSPPGDRGHDLRREFLERDVGSRPMSRNHYEAITRRAVSAGAGALARAIERDGPKHFNGSVIADELVATG